MIQMRSVLNFFANFEFKVLIALNLLLCPKFLDKTLNMFFSKMIPFYFKKRP